MQAKAQLKGFSRSTRAQTTARCHFVWQCILVLATLALGLVFGQPADAAAKQCQAAFSKKVVPAAPRPSAVSLEKMKSAKVGEEIVLQYSFAQADSTALLNAEVRNYLLHEIYAEVARLNETKVALDLKEVAAEKKASRSGLMNLVTGLKARGAADELTYLNSLQKANAASLEAAMALGEVVTEGGILDEKELALLQGYNFSERYDLKKKRDLETLTSRIESLNSGLALITGFDNVSTKSGPRVLRFAKTKRGMLAIMTALSLVGSAANFYIETHDGAQDDFHDVLVYDDRTAGQ
jgi:hypothetical protein